MQEELWLKAADTEDAQDAIKTQVVTDAITAWEENITSGPTNDTEAVNINGQPNMQKKA